ncbi:MAG: hypothetical protein U0271_37540 [Polyangiaceae bacterium]
MRTKLQSWMALGAVLSVGVACGDDSVTGGGGSGGGGGVGGGGVTTWPSHEVLELELDLTTDDSFGCLAPGVAIRWGWIADLTVADAGVSGWLAPSEFAADSQSIRQAFQSSGVTGTVDGPALTLASSGVYLSPWDEVEIDALSLERAADGSVTGSIAGGWTLFGGDSYCEVPFTASITGSADVRAPSVWLAREGLSPLLPFEPLELVATEAVVADSVVADVEIANQAAPSALSPIADTGRDGFARGLALSGSPAWPAGAALAIRLTGLEDAAGNDTMLELGPVALAVAPPSQTNPSFESAFAGWLTDPLQPTQPGVIGSVFVADHYEVIDDMGVSSDVLPADGGHMAVLSSNTRLIGYWAPQSGVTELSLSVGVTDIAVPELLMNDDGFAVELHSEEGALTGSVTPTTALYPDASSAWSGFATLKLPVSETLGTWIIVKTTGFAPPVHVPVVLVDDLRAN